MKIGVVAHIVNGKSGARAPVDLAKSLALMGNEVVFYARADNKDEQSVSELRGCKVKIVVINVDRRPLIGEINTAFYLKKQLKKDKLQILSLHCTMPFFLGSKLSGIPIVLTYHGTQFGVLHERFIPGSLLNILFFPLEILLNLIIWFRNAFYIWGSQEIVAISKYTQFEAKRLYLKKCKFIYWGAKPDNFLKNISRNDIKNEVLNIFTVSRYTPYKNFHQLIRIFQSIQKTHKEPMQFIIAGSLGSKKYLNYLKTLAAKNVHFQLNISDIQLSDYYKLCDVYITADTYLFFGMPVLEAASFGKPAVAFNYGAAPELIKTGETGFVVNSYNGFEEKLRLLIENKKLRERLGRKAKEWAEKYFIWENTAKEYVKVFNKVLNLK